MGLQATNAVIFATGDSILNSYLHINKIVRNKDEAKVYLGLRWYTSKANRDADVNNIAQPKTISTTQTVDCTQAEWDAITQSQSSILYDKLKTLLQAAPNLLTLILA